MKKILFLLGFLLALALPSFAVTDAGLVFEVDTVICSSSLWDTIKAANDTSTIQNATGRMKSGYTYYLQLGRLTGTSKDTCNLTVCVDAYSANDSLIGRAWSSDTSVDRSEMKLFTLPMFTGTTTHAVGVKHRVKIVNVSTGTTAAQCILNYMAILRARPVTYQKDIR